MRSTIFGSHMSRQGAPAVEPMCNTGVKPMFRSEHCFMVSKSLHPPTVVKPHECILFNTASAHRLASGYCCQAAYPGFFGSYSCRDAPIPTQLTPNEKNRSPVGLVSHVIPFRSSIPKGLLV